MNLPKSARTPTQSDYMNLEPKDVHIYQNTGLLSMKRGRIGAPPPGLVHSGSDAHITSPPPGVVMTLQSNNSPAFNNPTSKNSYQSNSMTAERHRAPVDPSHAGQSVPSTPASARRGGDSICPATSSYKRRREGLADSSFVEKKYGLMFTQDAPSPSKASPGDSQANDSKGTISSSVL